MNKTCFICKIEKPIEEFYKHKQMPDWHLNKCKECAKQQEKDRRKDTTRNAHMLSYDSQRNKYSISRIFQHKYYAIKERCTKIHKTKWIQKSVYWKDFLSKEEWIDWCYKEDNYKVFIGIYNNWVQSWFQRKYTPSIDRIDNNKWYLLWNLQWLTSRENTIKYAKNDAIYKKASKETKRKMSESQKKRFHNQTWVCLKLLNYYDSRHHKQTNRMVLQK